MVADITQTLLTGVLLGFSIAAPPGPVNALSAQQVVLRSWLSGWLVLLGATTADAIFFVLTFYGIVSFLTPSVRSILFLLGGVLMVYLAAATASRVRRRKAQALDARAGRWASSRRSPYVLGLSMGLTNPFQLGWWVAVGAGMVSEFGSSIAGGFFVGILCWTVAFSAAVHASVSRYERLAPLIAYASSAIMGSFGAWFLGLGLLTVL